MDKEMDKMINYGKLITHSDPKVRKAWLISAANEYGRLAQGVGGLVEGTNTIKFIKKKNILKDRRRDVTYGVFNFTKRPDKTETNSLRFVAGDNRINHPGYAATPTANMLIAKILINSVISTSRARFIIMNISNF